MRAPANYQELYETVRDYAPAGTSTVQIIEDLRTLQNEIDIIAESHACSLPVEEDDEEEE